MTDPREQEIKTISFGRKELDPAQEEDYKNRIAAAKKGGISALKGSTPVGHVERPAMPQLTRSPSQSSSGLTAEGGVAPRPPGSPVLSPATQQQLKGMQQAQAQEAAQAPQPATSLDEDAIKAGAASAAKEEVFDMFNFEGINEAERILNNKKRRKEIEDRCEPMNIEDLLLKDEVRQTVPILPGQFEARFRSLSPEESLFIKQFMAKDREVTESYAVEKFSMCQLACALVSINNSDFPDHRKPDGSPDEELFRIKLKKLMKKSGYVIADLSINYYWFDLRIRRLLAPEKLGNG